MTKSMKTPSLKSLLARVRQYAEDRPDCLVASSPVENAELLIFQLRRFEHRELIGDGPFTKFESIKWKYYAQPLLIDTRVKVKLTEQQKDTRDLMQMMGLVWCPIREFADLDEILGHRPETWTLESKRPEKIT